MPAVMIRLPAELRPGRGDGRRRAGPGFRRQCPSTPNPSSAAGTPARRSGALARSRRVRQVLAATNAPPLPVRPGCTGRVARCSRQGRTHRPPPWRCSSPPNGSRGGRRGPRLLPAQFRERPPPHSHFTGGTTDFTPARPSGKCGLYTLSTLASRNSGQGNRFLAFFLRGKFRESGGQVPEMAPHDGPGRPALLIAPTIPGCILADHRARRKTDIRHPPCGLLRAAPSSFFPSSAPCRSVRQAHLDQPRGLR